MLLQTTPKARRELHPGVQTFNLRQRSVLLLADGPASTVRLRRLFNGMGRQIVDELLRQGYLAPSGPRAAGTDEADRSPVEFSDL